MPQMKTPEIRWNRHGDFYEAETEGGFRLYLGTDLDEAERLLAVFMRDIEEMRKSEERAIAALAQWQQQPQPLPQRVPVVEQTSQVMDRLWLVFFLFLCWLIATWALWGR